MTSYRVAGLVACLSLLAAVGCDERSLMAQAPVDAGAADARGDARDGRASSQVDGGDASPPLTATLPPGFVAAPYVAVPRVAGTCSSADGQFYVPASAGETASLLVGRWQFCGGSAGVIVSGFRDGMELARDRSWRSLADVNGVLTPVTGVDNEGVWYLSAEDPNDMVTAVKWVVRVGVAGAFGNQGYPVEFLQNPSKIRLGTTAVYVWLGE
jgi:hypothetical protein